MIDMDQQLDQRLREAAERWRSSEPAASDLRATGTGGSTRGLHTVGTSIAIAATVAAAVAVPFALSHHDTAVPPNTHLGTAPTTPPSEGESSDWGTPIGEKSSHEGQGNEVVQLDPPPPGATSVLVRFECMTLGEYHVSQRHNPDAMYPGALRCGVDDNGNLVPDTSQPGGPFKPSGGSTGLQPLPPDGSAPSITVSTDPGNRWRLITQYRTVASTP